MELLFFFGHHNPSPPEPRSILSFSIDADPDQLASKMQFDQDP